MSFERMTVGRRLYLGFGLILAVLVAVTLVAIFKVQAINGALKVNSEEHAAIQRFAINFRGSAHDRAIAVRDVVLSESPSERNKELVSIEALAKFYAESAAPLEALMAKSSDQDRIRPLYEAIKQIEEQSLQSTRAIIEQTAAGDLVAARATLWNEAKPRYVAWLGAINRLIDFEEARIQSANAIAMR